MQTIEKEGQSSTPSVRALLLLRICPKVLPTHAVATCACTWAPRPSLGISTGVAASATH